MSMVSLSARERQNRDPPATTVADVLEFSYSATGASAKARGAVDDANKRLHDAGTGRARSVLRFRFNRCPAPESECRWIGIDIGAMHRQTPAIVCRLPRVAAQQRPDPAVGIPQLHASPIDRRISCDADNALPWVSFLSVLPRFPNLTRSWPRRREPSTALPAPFVPSVLPCWPFPFGDGSLLTVVPHF